MPEEPNTSPTIMLDSLRPGRKVAIQAISYGSPQQCKDLLDDVDDVAARANRHSVFYLIRPYLVDPDDEFLVELALASGSHYIITHNRDDFRDAERFGVAVVTPGQFLRIVNV